MTAATLDARTPQRRLIIKRAVALAKQGSTTAGSTPPGLVIDRCESGLIGSGHDFARQTLKAILQGRVDWLGKKMSPAEPLAVVRWAGTRGVRRRQ